MNKQFCRILLSISLLITLAGCVSTGNDGQVQSYAAPNMEAQWIIRGEPIEFEGELWYPQDGAETLLDSEVTMLMTYKGVQIFTDKLDVLPYKRLYTKFGYNQFRYFTKRAEDDSR